MIRERSFRENGPRRFLFRAAAALALGIVASTTAAPAARADAPSAAAAKQPTRVLYVEGTKTYWGEDTDPARAEDFRKFLADQFATVKSCKDVEFTPAAAEGVDVIVVDGDLRKRLPADLFRPMVLLSNDFCPIMLAENRGYKLQNT